MIITLTGFMGCGKSSIGKRLSELLCCRFLDMDSVIEEREGRPISEIFAEEGEAAFRKLEQNTLCEIIEGHALQPSPELIVALGGGTLTTAECAELVHGNTLCIYLRGSVETLMERLAGGTAHRPLLTGSDLRERIEDLMALRSGTYEKTAHIIIDTDGYTVEELAIRSSHLVREGL